MTHVAELDEQHASSETRSVAESGPAPGPDLVAFRLLHVEDNPSDALLMQEYVQGILPSVTFDNASRLSEVTVERAAAADCALLDLSLPDASGLDALVTLRKMSEQLPIIVLTGFDDMSLGLKAVRDGADDYLVKNHVDGFTLERAVQYAIERRRLMLQLVMSAAETVVANADMITADAATQAALDQMRQAVRESERPDESRVVAGTHAVSVRIDSESYDFVLDCQTCAWSSDRRPDDAHSWAARALEATLLRHVYFEGLDDEVAPVTAQADAAGPGVERAGEPREDGLRV
jgi:CheY-like chemotaxis protein